MKKKEPAKKPESVEFSSGNAEFLKVKLLSDISMYLKRIAEALEKE